MNNYYGRLTESILSKYTINESTSLDEAWSSTMPDWFKKALTKVGDTQRMYKSKVYQKAYDLYKAQGASDTQASHRAKKEWELKKGALQDYAEYKKPRKNSEGYDTSLVDKLMKLGINLHSDKVKYEELEVPQTKSEFTELRNNFDELGELMPIFFIENKDPVLNQVYIPTINDTEKVNYGTARGVESAEGKSFGYISYKQLKELTTHFAIADFYDAESPDYIGTKQKRNKNLQYTIQDIIDGRERVNLDTATPKDYQNTSLYINKGMFDKSGYIKIPTAKKYAEKLKELKLRRYAQDITDAEKSLNTLVKKYQNAISHVDVEVLSSSNFRRRQSEFIRYFASAKDKYTYVLNMIDIATRASGTDEKLFYAVLKDRGFTQKLEILKEQVLLAEDSLSNYIYTELDF